MKKINNLSHKTFSTLLIIGVIVGALLINILLSVLYTNNLLYIDMSPETQYTVYSNGVVVSGSTKKVANYRNTKYAKFYTLTDETVSYLTEILDEVNEGEETPVHIDIIFCADPDILCSSSYMKMVYYTALNLQKNFPENIFVSTVDVYNNPSAVDIYRANSYSSIYQSNIIIASGTEFRVRSLNSFFTFSSDDDDTPWAYNGEKSFIQQILSVTRAESPIACITTNHGEPFANLDLNDVDNWTEYNYFIYSLQNAGYEVQYINLETDEIPENCRLIITYDPQTDFKSVFGDDVEESETVKLDKFLDNAYSFMIFMDADSPKLPNLETYLEKWGIAYDRGTDAEENDGNYVVNQPISLGANGYTFQGISAEVGLGYSLLQDMLESGSNPTVAFSNAMPINFTYEIQYVAADSEEGTPAFTYGYQYKNSIARSVYTVYSSTTDANAYLKVDGEVTEIGKTGQFNVMTISAEDRQVNEGQSYTSVHDMSYVCAFGSTDFAKNQYLEGKTYGNNDVLLSTFRTVSHEVDPVGIAFVSLYDEEIDADATTDAYVTGATIALVACPIVICLGICAVVMVRRKFKY